MMHVAIRKSHRPEKKLEAVVDGTKTVPFGQAGASDFTIHKDPARKQRYVNRHKKNEDWTKSGIATKYAKHSAYRSGFIVQEYKRRGGTYEGQEAKRHGTESLVLGTWGGRWSAIDMGREALLRHDQFSHAPPCRQVGRNPRTRAQPPNASSPSNS